MASDLTYKLSQWQVVPPPGVWKQLRTRLDEEYDVNDVHLAMKLDEAGVVPPSLVWEKIRSELQGSTANRTGRVIALPYRKLAVAAAFIGMIGFAAWYFLMFGGSDNAANGPAVTAAVGTTITPKKNNASVAPGLKTPDKPIIASSNTPPVVSLNPASTAATRPVPVRRDPSTQKRSTGKRLATPSYALSPVIPDRQISIDAPPIRDEQGNIVMNVQLLKSSEDDRYIIVTSPNGQQTRISEKFLNVLQYLHVQDEDYIGPDIYQRHLWKQRILDWKNKLIHSAGFIPSNNNFLGIMDLKELVQQDK
jgi:hypothetical protein